MKKFIGAVVVLSFLAGISLAQAQGTNAPLTIPANQAKAHLNATATITGKVAEVNKAAKLVRLNSDKPFPNQSFTAVIFAEKTNLFPSIDQLKGKTIEVTGKISDYRGRPEIILVNTNQLKVVTQVSDSTP